MDTPATSHTDSIAHALGLAQPEPLTRTVYLILESDTYYNDEYITQEDGYVAPQAAFTDEAAATARASELNAARRAAEDVDDWYDNEVPDLFHVVPVQLTEGR